MLGSDRAATRLSLTIGAAGLLLAAVACGATGAGRAAGLASPATLAPDDVASAGAAPSPAADQDGARGRSVATTQGVVTVVSARGAFVNGSGIAAVVANGSAADIYVQDLRTGCSIAILERGTGAALDRWQPVPDCGAERLAVVLAIAPAHGRTVRIDLQSLASAGQPLAPGTYRLAVPWRRVQQGAGADSVARSAPFVVR